MNGIAVLDAGGQYCHLLARRVRELGVRSHVLPIDLSADRMRGIQGIIISGGPRSVTEPDAPQIHPSIFDLRVPILGICYGHQLLASLLPGGVVRPSTSREYGIATLRRLHPQRQADSILSGVPAASRVWMSHGDSVLRTPDDFEVLASTDDCPVAAMANTHDNMYGVQFHPEVTHTEHGREVLRNFVVDVCGCESDWKPSSNETIEEIKAGIRASVRADQKVLFFVSGGVDSSVAYKLCVDALGNDRVYGVYVDTGFMRLHESDEVMNAFAAAGFANVRREDSSSLFLNAVDNIVEPEIKRAKIGSEFLNVENAVLAQLPAHQWLLGQGTIYPDTIESGGTRNSALIKTHHNRVPELLKRIEAGEVVEPLVQFYKDEVRAIGRALALPDGLISKQPFPGPGLAVRFLCSEAPAPWRRFPNLEEAAAGFGFRARALPLKAVGVQGDERTYAHVAVLDGPYEEQQISDASRAITNQVPEVNRVAYWLGAKAELDTFSVERRMTIDQAGLDILRAADAVVREILDRSDVSARIWQCPVVLVPLSSRGLLTIAIRPVDSHDGMTAQYVRLPLATRTELIERVLAIDGVGALLYDVTNKPPATIEWE